MQAPLLLRRASARQSHARVRPAGWSPSRLTTITFAAAMLCATTARAQGHGAVAVSMTRNEALAPGASLYGASLTFGGGLAIRLSGALLPERRDGGYVDTVSVRGWTADADLVLNLSRSPWSRSYDGPSVNPYAFIGVGEMAMRDRFTEREDRWRGYSYGGGAALPVLAWLAVHADGRYRRAWDGEDRATPITRAYPRGWEYRFGIAVGGGR